MIEKFEKEHMNILDERGETKDRYLDLAKLIRNEALIEAEPSLEFLNETSLSSSEGGSMYYGTGLTTPRAISVGVPFDMLGMMLTAEKIRRTAGLERVYHHIADTHAKTNDWINPSEVDEIAEKTLKTLESIKRNLGLDEFEFVLSSSFDKSDEYKEIVKSFEESNEHEYVRLEMADMEWYRTKADVRIKMGWIIQSKETEMGFDERRFDREYLRFHPGQMSFVYTKPGRTFNSSRPKASPYISIADEDRLLLEKSTNVVDIFNTKEDPTLGGAKKHLQSIVRLFESIYGSLGKIGENNLSFEDKVQYILDRCLAD